MKKVRDGKVIGLWIGICTVIFMLLIAAGCGNDDSTISEQNDGTEGTASSNGEDTEIESDEEGQSGNGQETTSNEELQPEQSHVEVGLPVDTATFLPLYIADQHGYFEEEGLNVEIYGFQGDSGVVQALVGDSVDINVASLTGLVKSIDSGQPFRAFWGGFNHSDFEWYSPSIDSMDQAAEKMFGITSYGSLTDSLTRYALKENGLNPETDVEVLQAGGSSSRIAAMESGQMDVSILATPFKFMAADQGMNLLLSMREDISETYPNHVIYGTEEFVENNPQTIKAFLRGVYRGMEVIEEDPDSAIEVVMSKLQFEEKYAKLAVEDVSSGFDKNGEVDKTGLDFFWELSVDAGEVEEAWPDEKWLDKSFIDSQDEWIR